MQRAFPNYVRALNDVAALVLLPAAIMGVLGIVCAGRRLRLASQNTFNQVMGFN